jgi:hypothetical protein
MRIILDYRKQLCIFDTSDYKVFLKIFDNKNNRENIIDWQMILKPKLMKQHLPKMILVLLICLMDINVFAQDYTWVGTAGNNDFFDESNWENTSGTSPASGTIDPNKNINLGLQLSCNLTVTENIQLGTGKLYLLDGSLSAPAIVGGEVLFNDNGYLKLTTSIVNSTNVIMNFRSPISWVETTKNRPAEISASYLNRFKINGTNARFPNNIRLDDSYYAGTIVRPNNVNAKALIVYDQTALEGNITEFGLNQVYSGTAIPNIKSFRLRKGFMATMAVNSDGTGKSKVFIASDKDMIVNTLPTVLSGGVSFIRVVPWNWVNKRGTGGDKPNMQVTWFYDWGLKSKSNLGREYAPMTWGKSDADDDKDITTLRNIYKATHVLAFNEPDDCHAQSGQYFDMCVTDVALGYYKNLMKTGIRLVSPACREGAATTWLKDFHDKAVAQDIRIDVIAVHWYDWASSPKNSPDADPQQVFNRFKNYLNNIYNIYGLPIWITEFNANPNRNTPVHREFMKLALPYLDNLSYVERYAWFEPFPADGATTGNANFYDENGNLTQVGAYYNAQGTSNKSISSAIWGGPNNLDKTSSGGVDEFVCGQTTEEIVEEIIEDIVEEEGEGEGEENGDGDGTTNISPATNSNYHMSIFPNPATNEINVSLNGLDIKEISICDINGKLIQKATSSTNIDISALPNGIYFIKANHFFSKFIKN